MGAHLQEDVEHVGVGLLDLVKEHDAVRPPAHRLGQQPALPEPDVPRGRAQQLAHRVPLHKLAHVEPHQRILHGHQRSPPQGAVARHGSRRCTLWWHAHKRPRVTAAGSNGPSIGGLSAIAAEGATHPRGKMLREG